MKKLGFDIHGVIDSNPKYFATVIKGYKRKGHEIHVITGSMDTPEIHEQLQGWGIEYDRFFSIGEWCKKNSDTYYEDERGRPWDDAEVWNKVKAIYCDEVGIDIHIDDSHDYWESFQDISTEYYLMDVAQGYTRMDATIAIDKVIETDCDNYPCNKNCPQYSLYKKRAYAIIAKSDLSVEASNGLAYTQHHYGEEKVDRVVLRQNLKRMIDQLVEDIFMEFG